MAKLIFLAFVATATALVVQPRELDSKPFERKEKPSLDSKRPKNGKHEVEAKPFEALSIVEAVDGKAVVQNLRSDEGMAYYGTMFVGGQEQVCIYDTGSFETVIESKCVGHQKKHSFVDSKDKKGNLVKVQVAACCTNEKCPFAKYSTHVSGPNFKSTNDEIEQITYGSGPVLVKHGNDHVRLSDETLGKTKGNSIAAADVPIKIIVDHDVDLFKETEMTAIVGVGPGKFEERNTRLIHKMGVKRFMVCFQENTKANGFWTWHDRDRSGDKAWMAVPVAGKQFWAVPTSNFMIDGSSIGCTPSCGGIIDTGTSLITPPQAVVTAIQEKIEAGTIEDCSDLSKFPDFEFQLGDHKLSLPATSYVADAGVQNIEVFHQHLAFAPLPMSKKELKLVELARKNGQDTPPVHSCVLLLSPGDESEVTQFGPMVIFGMSLFRKYAIQFDLSADMAGKDNGRVMRFAEAAHDCSGPVRGGEFRRTKLLTSVNVDKLRVSPLQQRLRRNNDHNLKQKIKGEQYLRKGTLRI